MRVSILVLFAMSILIAGAPAFAGEADVCTGSIIGNKVIPCATLDEAKANLRCGLTDLSHPNCGSDMDDCFFAIGEHARPEWVAIEWLKDADTGSLPSAAKCRALRAFVEGCPHDLGELIRECPDETISGIEECNFFCEEGRQVPDTGILALWDESCRAYALMPKGWDHWTPAAGFFAVGRHFPGRLLSLATSEANPMTARQALAEQQLGPTLLGAVGFSPLWGTTETGAVAINEKVFKRSGLCVDHRGALMASPLWSAFKGIGQFPVVASCKGSGINLYDEVQGGHQVDLTNEVWRMSGALMVDVLPRLQRGAIGSGFELVCVTPELANRRRSLRSKDAQ